MDQKDQGRHQCITEMQFFTRESKRILKEQAEKATKKVILFWCSSFNTDREVVTKETEMSKVMK